MSPARHPVGSVKPGQVFQQQWYHRGLSWQRPQPRLVFVVSTSAHVQPPRILWFPPPPSPGRLPWQQTDTYACEGFLGDGTGKFFFFFFASFTITCECKIKFMWQQNKPVCCTVGAQRSVQASSGSMCLIRDLNWRTNWKLWMHFFAIIIYLENS